MKIRCLFFKVFILSGFLAVNISDANGDSSYYKADKLQLESDDEWGDEDDWEEEDSLEWGFKSSLGYGELFSDNSNLKDSVLKELRNSLELMWKGEDTKIESEFEFLVDDIRNENDFSIYSLNFTHSGFQNTDIKVGRQVITWGTGDLLFLNDLFSKSWKSFFNGRNDKYLKPAVDAVRISYYGSTFNWELAILPNFEPDQTPDGERYSFFLPGTGVAQPINTVTTEVPSDSEYSGRFFGQSKGVEWAIYFYSGFFKSPSKFENSMTYAEMDSVGASVRMPALGGLLSSEFSYYDSKEDPSGRNPLINNSQLRFLIGYENEIATNTTLASQLYLEKTLDYRELFSNTFVDQILPKENRTMLTFRLTNLALQQRLTNSIMLFYSPSDKDHYLRASAKYKYDDNWTLVFGLNLLEGDTDETFLAQMKDNSNWFTRVEYRL